MYNCSEVEDDSIRAVTFAQAQEITAQYALSLIHI